MAFSGLISCLIIIGMSIFQGVNLQGEQWIDVGQNAELYCMSVPATFQRLQWRKSSFSVMDGTDALIIIMQYTQASDYVQFGGSVDQAHYAFDKTHPQYPLTIIGFNEADSARYWCRIISGALADAFWDVRTRVPPSVITIASGPYTLSNGDTVVLTAEAIASFTCTVPNIRPAASFTWTLDSTVLPSTTPQPNQQKSGDNVTSVSSVEFQVQADHHSKRLECKATNKPADIGVQTHVILYVNVPPKSVKLSDTNGDKTNGVTVTVNEELQHDFTCLVQGTRPAATIQWFIDIVLQSSGVSTTNMSSNNDQFDTTGTFAFIPSRADHRDMLKCEAYTAQSPRPYPSSYVSIIVNGPPDTPIITGVTSPMKEGIVVTLTCEADMGYPDDWRLEWTRGNPPMDMTEPATTSTASGTRYKFTNMLEFTPTRADNGNRLTCTARKDSFVTAPAGLTDVFNVQYQASITNKEDNVIGADSGQTAVLVCKAEGNPAPRLRWFDQSYVEITNDRDRFSLMNKTDETSIFRYKAESRLTIQTLNPETDHGVYFCICSNGIGEKDNFTIIVIGPTPPKPPRNVKVTSPTESSLTVKWEPGRNGGKTQRFHVKYLETPDSPEQPVDEDPLSENAIMYTVTGLKPYTEYEIRVYAENVIGMNPTYGSATGRTLPMTPNTEDFTFIYNLASGTVEVNWPSSADKYQGSCIQLEVKYQGNMEWQNCGDCIESPQTVTLSAYCSKEQQRRKRQTTGEIEEIEVQARLCYDSGNICGPPANVNRVTSGDPGSSIGLIIGIVAGCLFLSAGVILIIFVWWKRRNTCALDAVLPTKLKRTHGETCQLSDNQLQKSLEMDAIPSSNQALTYVNAPPSHRPFPRNQLTIVKELGHGAFGVVFLADATGIVERSKTTLVAVKSVKERAGASDKANLVAELDLMKKLPDHRNVVKLLGFCVQQDPPYIIVEYLSHGNLKDLLKDSRSKGGRVYGNLHGMSKSLTSNDLMKFAVDVADGMHFISSQQCIHRDLAARNVLVAEDMTCKVSDFGLARDVMNVRVYERTSEGNLPLRWMALESILCDTYTTESDVWSYGVLLWEIVTLGARPYPAMSAKMMVEELQSGYRMPKPKHCQQEIYDIMVRCWEEDADWRPKFEMIGRKLKALLNKEKQCILVKEYEESIYEVTLPKDDNEKV